MFIQSSVRPTIAARTNSPSTTNASKIETVAAPPQPQESFENSSVLGSALKAAAVGAAYGALVGGSTNALYKSTDLMTATGIHAAGIVGGGALGSVVLGKPLQKKAEPPAAYALGALAGAGVTWATSAFGMLASPTVGIVAGAALGAFFGAVGGAIHASKGTNDRQVPTAFADNEQNPQPAPPEKGPGLPKGAWSGLSVAYGVAGAGITGAMIAKGVAGTLTPGAAFAGGLVAAGAFANSYLTYKTAAMKG